MPDRAVTIAIEIIQNEHNISLKDTFLDKVENPVPILRSLVNIAMNWHHQDYDCWAIGKQLQRQYISNKIPFKTELEVSAGFWYLIHEGKIS